MIEEGVVTYMKLIFNIANIVLDEDLPKIIIKISELQKSSVM